MISLENLVLTSIGVVMTVAMLGALALGANAETSAGVAIVSVPLATTIWAFKLVPPRPGAVGISRFTKV